MNDYVRKRSESIAKTFDLPNGSVHILAVLLGRIVTEVSEKAKRFPELNLRTEGREDEMTLRYDEKFNLLPTESKIKTFKKIEL